MTLFDRYIAVDWSASSTPSAPDSADSIWIAEAHAHGGDSTLTTTHHRTRSAAMQFITERLRAARAAGERVLAGFDFPFGYPEGGARLIGAGDDWQALWSFFAARVTDDDRNGNNRFALANDLNAALSSRGAVYWGRPETARHAHLHATKAGTAYGEVPEKRNVEAASRSASSVWKLFTTGSVGGQAMLGIARLEQLRRDPALAPHIAVWPFETAFEQKLDRPIILAEIYPSIFAHDRSVTPKDKAQVQAVATTLQSYDRAGRLGELLAFPSTHSENERTIALREEGWILGESAARDASKVKLAPITPRQRGDWLADPDAITTQSFAIIRREAKLDHLRPALHTIARRMIHACGMVDIASHIRGSAALYDTLRRALAANATILCDCEAVRAAITRKIANPRLVTLSDPATAERATAQHITRSAAAVDLWLPHLHNAIVVIGNAPTALFRLLDLLADGAPHPAAIIATPVGFVGAAESKDALVAEAGDIPFVTLLGRRGGSAIAAAALNASVLGEGQ